MRNEAASFPPFFAKVRGPGALTLLAAKSLRYRDVDEQACALNGWNQAYLQLSAGSFQGEICQIEGTHARIFVEEVRQSVLQTGELPSDVWAVGVPLATSGLGLFCGAPCGANAFHVFSGSTGFEFRTAREHVMLGLEVRPQNTRRGFAGDPTNPLAFEFPMRAGAGQLDSAAHAEVKRYLLSLFESVQRNPALLSSPAVVATVLDYLTDRITPIGRVDRAFASNSHWKLVQTACSLLADKPEQAPTMAQLCASLGVSRRTLQNGFHGVLNVSPLAYLKAYRLDQARQALKCSNSVTEAATACGFWHFGHFSHDYLAMFGERPSDTLRRHVAR